MEAQKAREEAQKARDLRLAELKKARELCELELKALKEKALLEAEKVAAAGEHELKMAGLGRHPPIPKCLILICCSFQSVVLGLTVTQI